MKINIKKKIDITTLAPILFLLLLVVIYSIFAKNFLSGPNILNILRQVSITGIMAIGVTLVILLGEIDLSIGTVMAFCGMMAGGLSTGKYFGLPALPVGVAILITLLIGAVIGLISGIACAKLRIPGFMATLAMEYVCSGLMLMITKAKPISSLPSSLVYWGSGYLFGIPVIIYVFIFVFVLAALLLKYSIFGRNLYAIGGSLEASRMSGINVIRNKVLAFVICSVLCALAGILMDGRIGSAQVTAGDSLQMTPIAAAVLGGTSLAGGKGTMAGTFLGVLIMGVLVNGLNLMGVGSDVQKLVTGIVLFIAVTFNIWSSKKSR